MDEQVNSPDSLRDALEASFEKAEQGELQPVVGDPVPSEVTDKPRDEQGKFTKTEQVDKNPSPVATTHDIPQDEPLQRPTTWKKEYLPLWDKLQSGQPLTQEESIKFLKYANQRETEYKTGVSTYKTEAENAKALQEAISPFLPELQANGIHPAAWINNLGRAHVTMVKGSPQEKASMFAKLVNDYQVNPVDLFNTLGFQIPDGYSNQQSVIENQKLQEMQQRLDNLQAWTENEKNTRLQSMIDKVKNDVENYPHFEEVRGTMAQLLESGLAPTLETAYAKAVRMQDDVWQIEQERLLSQAKQEASKTQQVAKAKAAAVSLKSATPSGQGISSGAKDRRSALAEAFDSVAESRV